MPADQVVRNNGSLRRLEFGPVAGELGKRRDQPPPLFDVDGGRRDDGAPPVREALDGDRHRIGAADGLDARGDAAGVRSSRRCAL
jgi:hypothetical protein